MKKGLMLMLVALFALPIFTAGGYKGGSSRSSKSGTRGRSGSSKKEETYKERQARETQDRIRGYYPRPRA